MGKIGNALLELLFPNCCVSCGGKLLAEEQMVCDDCVALIARTEHISLTQNGVDMLFAELIQQDGQKLHYEGGAAFAYYNRERGQFLRRMIEKGKFGIHPYNKVFYHLGSLAGKEYIDAELFDSVDYLVPIPLHPRRLRERGFNQAEEICKGLSTVLHIPIDTQHLVRVRNNPHQSRALFEQRKNNVKDLFDVHHPDDWKGKHIVLVDDVITSGATMMACMKKITPIRDCQISVFALGWAHK